MEKVKISDLENLHVGSETYMLGFDKTSGKVGLVAASEVDGRRPWFGRRWNKNEASPVGVAIGDLDLGRILGSVLGLGGYLVNNDHSRRKLLSTNHRFLGSGEAADLSGADGHYQWGWNRPFWYQCYEDETFFYETISIGGPRPGFWNYYIPVGSRSCAGWAAMDRTNSVLMSCVNDSEQFRGGKNDASADGQFNSMLGKPATNLSMAAFRTAARKNGELWFANERVMHFITCALKRIILGTRNIQAPFNASLDADGLRQGGTGDGAGLPTEWSVDFGYQPYLPLSAGIENGDYTGTFNIFIEERTAAKTISGIPSFFGLKNDYKYLGVISENMILMNNEDNSQSMYAPLLVDGSLMSTSSVDALTLIGTGPSCEAAGWVYPKEYYFKNLAFMPKEAGGSQSTYFCDGYYNDTAVSGLRGALLLGYADFGGIAGSLFLDGGDGVSRADAGLGAFLCEWAEAFTTEPFWCMENK